MSKRAILAIVLLAVLLAGAVAARLSSGGPLSDQPASIQSEIRQIRERQALCGLIVGVSLAVSGAMLQSLLRNPLASPDILGLASGASLAVMLAIYLSRTFASAASSPDAVSGWQAGPALAGSLAALGLVYLLSQRRGLIDPPSLVLIGVIISIMCGAATMLLQHLLPGGFGASRLLLGALSDDTTWAQLAGVGALAGAGTLVGIASGRAMDAAAMGDDEARSVGVPLSALRATLFILSGAMTAGAVVVAGPIGFVGLVCPHIARLLAGAGGGGQRSVILGSALAGAALIVGADALVATLKSAELTSGRLPIGVLTAILGGPAFIILLRRQRTGPGAGM